MAGELTTYERFEAKILDGSEVSGYKLKRVITENTNNELKEAIAIED